MPVDIFLLLSLVKKPDVVIDNFRAGTMDRLGVGYKVLKKFNKEIIYAYISGFGHHGSYKNRYIC